MAITASESTNLTFTYASDARTTNISSPSGLTRLPKLHQFKASASFFANARPLKPSMSHEITNPVHEELEAPASKTGFLNIDEFTTMLDNLVLDLGEENLPLVDIVITPIDGNVFSAKEEAIVRKTGLADSSRQTRSTVDIARASNLLTTNLLDDEAKTDARLQEYDETVSPLGLRSSNPVSLTSITSPITGNMPHFSFFATDSPASPMEFIASSSRAPNSAVSEDFDVMDDIRKVFFDPLSRYAEIRSVMG